MELFLIITAIVVPIMIFIASLYVLVYFQSEEDKNTAYAPKLAFVLGLSLACLAVLLLPMDVANRNEGGGIDMRSLYQFVYFAVAIMVAVVIPFLIFHYEAWDPESNNSQLCTALKYESVTVLVAATVVGLMWHFLGEAQVPYEEYTYNRSALLSTGDACDAAECPSDSTAQFYEIKVSPFVYVMALVSFLGWFLLVLFGGIGLAALPIDLLLSFRRRPRSINLEEFARQKMLINERAAKLLSVGDELGTDASRSRERKMAIKYNKFRQAVYFVEEDWERVQEAYKERGGNPLKHLFFFVMGFVSLALSVLWATHLVLYVFISPPASLFLNEYFEVLDDFFPLFGTLTYGLFAFYLLFCVLKGCIKFGLRFFCLRIHPMRIGKTLMSSLLFNLMLLLITSVCIVQLCAIAFASYARLTAADMLFGVQARNLLLLQWFYRSDAFLYAIFVIAGIATAWLITCPRDQRALVDADDRDLAT